MSGLENSVTDVTGIDEPYACVMKLTDPERGKSDDREMNVLVTIRVVDDEGEELGTSTGSFYSAFDNLDDLPQRAFEIALEHLEVDL
jgi:hypothetical protein